MLLLVPLLLNPMHLRSTFLFPSGTSRRGFALCACRTSPKLSWERSAQGQSRLHHPGHGQGISKFMCLYLFCCTLQEHPPSQEAAAKRGAAKHWGGKAQRKRKPNAVTLALGHHLRDRSAPCLCLVQINPCYHGGIWDRGFFWDQVLDRADGLCFLSPVSAQLHLH